MSILEPYTDNRPTHIATYHLQEGSRHEFQIRLGQEGKFEHAHPALTNYPKRLSSLVHVEIIPAEFSNAVSSWLEARQPFENRENHKDPFHRYLGSLSYIVTGETAVTTSKFPKSLPEDFHRIILKKAAPRWGSHIEALCVKHLEKLGVKFISSGQNPSDDVCHVLNQAGLAVGKIFPIRQWYEKLEAYYQNRRKN